MRIKKVVYRTIIEGIENDGMESGGLLGIDITDTVTEVVLDKGLRIEGMKRCNYYPNIDLFNNCLAKWSDQSIRFGGIYHIHFSDTPSFSDGDLKYIEEIVSVLPKQFGDVYFPILLVPSNTLIPFRVGFTDNKIHLYQEELIME